MNLSASWLSRSTPRCYRRLPVSLLAGLLSVGAARGQTQYFDIPAEGIDQAIADFARQSQLQIVAPTGQLHGVKTRALQGSFDSREALRRLIAGTGLTVQTDRDAVIVLRMTAKPPDPPRANRPAITARANVAPSAAAINAALEEVVVTVEKVATSALRTPASIAVYGADVLQENHVHSLSDLPNIDPSLNVSHGNLGNTISLRGVTSADVTSKGTPDVVLTLDGVPVNRGFEQAETLFDLERIELLKGPQGTLYGASSTGGALNVITAKPKDVFGLSGELTVGDFGTQRATAVFNAPVTPSLAVRAAVDRNYHDGYYVLADGTPYTAGEDDLAARFSALLRPADGVALLVQNTSGRVRGPGTGTVNDDTLLRAPSGQGQRVVFENPYGQRVRDDFDNLTAQFDDDMGAAHLTYVGGHLEYSADEAISNTDNPRANDAPLYSQASYGWHDYVGRFLTDSHELRLINREPSDIDWLLGGHWFQERLEESDHYWSGQAPAGGGLPTLTDLTNVADPVNTTRHLASGVFAQATWHAGPRWEVTGGLRQTWDVLERRGTFAAGPVVGCIAPASCIGGPNDGEEHDRQLTYRSTLSVHLSALQMLFATLASGFKGGGFNDFCGTGLCPYGPEKLQSYELGYKGRPRENIEINSDLFFYDFSAMQIPEVALLGGNPVLFTGVYSASIAGWENDLEWHPTRMDGLHVSVTQLRSRYGSLRTHLPAPTGIGADIDLVGRTLSTTPSTAAVLGYFHDMSLGGGATLRLHLTIKYSSAYQEVQIAPYYPYTQPAFTRSNAEMRLSSADGRRSISAYVLNIENRLQITAPPADGGTVYPDTVTGVHPVSVSDPRTWGITVALRL